MPRIRPDPNAVPVEFVHVGAEAGAAELDAERPVRRDDLDMTRVRSPPVGYNFSLLLRWLTGFCVP
jgi:hypothetical protein